MIDGRPRSATVTAVEPLTALAIPHQNFEVAIGRAKPAVKVRQ